jgi:hypothetical protein
MMRILSYALIICGFFYICFCQFEIGPLERASESAQFEKLPKQQSYTVEDVHKAIYDTVGDMADRVPSFYIGACIMLVGSMILDRTKRPK